jgi:hypothetical protein
MSDPIEELFSVCPDIDHHYESDDECESCGDADTVDLITPAWAASVTRRLIEGAVQAERDRCEAELGEIYFLMDNHGGCLDPGCPNLEPIAAVIARLDAWALAAIEGVTDE